MKPITRNIIIGVVVVIALLLLARYVVFKDKFEQASQGLEAIGVWQENYKRKNPNATKAEVDAAFEVSMGNLKLWQERYKQDHPNATKAEMDAAFNAQFAGNDPQ